MNGLLVNNDKNNLLISSDVTPLTYSHKLSRDFKVNKEEIPISSEDGSFVVWHRGDTASRIQDIGIYQAFFSSPTYVGKRVYDQSAALPIEQYIFKAKPTQSSGSGLQMFNAQGVETFNSEKPLLSIIDRVSINVADAYEKPIKQDFDGTLFMDRTLWSKNYPNYSKLGILFTNAPAGVAKTNSIYQIWAYFYNFRTAGSLIELAYRAEYWSYSQSSAVIELDLNLKLEFFVIDLSNVA